MSQVSYELCVLAAPEAAINEMLTLVQDDDEIELIELIACYAIDSVLERLNFDSNVLSAMEFQRISSKRACGQNLMYEVQ